MARSKKSRKEGALMKKLNLKRPEKIEKEARKRKSTGNKAGSRQQVVQSKTDQNQSSQSKDPRIGSKKPIDLGVQTIVEKPKNQSSKVQTKQSSVAKVYVQDNTEALEQELLAIENNMELHALSERSEAGEELTNDEKDYLESNLARYQQLLAQLNLEQDDDEDTDTDVDSEDDMWDKLDSYNFDDYKDQ
ncbi:Der GTPase-activating protein YihI [Thalassotalea aquiviva]|uniref:Der GTPase-activating protein YihI n=1 Tax=Thalassotalea aquiviva TaxID=3242415 RepID=UPI003529E6EE